MKRPTLKTLGFVVPALLAVACGAKKTQTSQVDEFSSRTNFGSNGGLPAKTLVLTFDDGPGPKTEAIARYLHKEGISATFFVVAGAAESRPGTMKLLRELGHVVANHTRSHPQMSRLTRSKRIFEVRDTHRVIKPFLVDGIQVFRAPFGDWAAGVARDLNGQTDLRDYVGPVFWDIGGGQNSSSWAFDADWACANRGTSAKTCADRYFKETVRKDKGIVLFHDNNLISAEMVPLLVPRWKAAGFKFARIDQVPAIKRELKKTSTYKPGSGTGTPVCSAPRLDLLKKNGTVLRIATGPVSTPARFQGNAVVDTKSARARGHSGKFFVKFSNDDVSNLAFSLTNSGKTLSGVRYNISWDSAREGQVSLKWDCDAYKGSINYGAVTESLSLRF